LAGKTNTAEGGTSAGQGGASPGMPIAKTGSARLPAGGTRETRLAKLVRRTLLLLLLVGVPLALVIYLPYLAWENAEQIELELCVVDKTVPFTDYREHRGLFWLLGQNKIVRPGETSGRRFYDYTRDYVGAYPAAQTGLEGTSLLSMERLARCDVLYVADTYGVYADDYGAPAAGAEPQDRMHGPEAHTAHSSLLFGGLQESEVEAIEQFAARDGLLIAEFNTFASPTSEPVRRRMERVLGVNWTGWSGRYFTDFGDEQDVPAWFYGLYQAREGQDLRERGGSGFLLVHDPSQEFIMLWDGGDLLRGGVEFVPLPAFAESDALNGVAPSNYSYWIDLVEPLGTTQVLAEFRFHLSEQGERKMTASGLDSTPPAVLRQRGTSTAYYFAGDMCDFGRPLGPYNTRLTLFLNQRYFSVPVKGGHGQFFWHSYYPMLTNILKDRADGS